MEPRPPRYDWANLAAQVKASSDEDLFAGYPLFHTALKLAERRKFIEPGAAQFGAELVAEKNALNLRELLEDEFGIAAEEAAKVPKTAAAAPPAGEPPRPRAVNVPEPLAAKPVPRTASAPAAGRLQWAIIWASLLTAAHVWLRLDLTDLWPSPGSRWGLWAYLYPAYTYHRPELAFAILVVGALLFWQISVRRSPGTGTPFRSIAAISLSTRALVVICIIILLFLLGLHFRPARQSERAPASGGFDRGFGTGFGKF